MDSMIYNGRECDLAKMNMKMARLIDRTEKSATVVEAYTNELETVRAALGDDTAKELLETLNIEEIDLTELVLIYNAVTAGYESRLEAARRAKESADVDRPALKAVRDMAADVRVIQSVNK